MIRKILISFVIIYSFYGEFLQSILGLNEIKIVLAVLTSILFFTYLFVYAKKLKFSWLMVMPFILIPIFIYIWGEVGYINLFYTMIFGWVLSQNYKFSLKLIKITFIVHLLFVLYETFTKGFIFDSIASGVLKKNEFDVSYDFQYFDYTGFRPKGLFAGTLVATSFVIYLVMIFRNNILMLFWLFILALLTNGRLALIIAAVTFILKFILKFDIRLQSKKLSFFLKSMCFIVPVTLILFFVLLSLPSVVRDNYLDAFNLNSMSNAGRIFSYLQSILLFLDYSFLEKLFGNPSNEVVDMWGRLTASESGLLSMILDIGLIGLFIYLYYIYISWVRDKGKLININLRTIGFKYVLLITFLSFFQYEHINGNVRGALFWFLIISNLRYSHDKSLII